MLNNQITHNATYTPIFFLIFTAGLLKFLEWFNDMPEYMPNSVHCVEYKGKIEEMFYNIRKIRKNKEVPVLLYVIWLFNNIFDCTRITIEKIQIRFISTHADWLTKQVLAEWLKRQGNNKY